MLPANYHLHSSFSPDSSTPPEAQVRAAEQLGISEICFTDHVERYDVAYADFVPNVPEYAAIIRGLHSRSVRVKFGAEAGMKDYQENQSELCDLLGTERYDFVIASLHFVGNYSPFMPEFFNGFTPRTIFPAYISTLYRTLKGFDTAYWDSVGHIDFMTKGIHGWADPRMCYRDAADELDTLFRYLIDNGKCFEYNTASYAAIPYLSLPGADWIKRWHELGGEYITIGTDAHTPDRVGLRLEEATEMIRSTGVRYYSTFEDHKPILHRL